MAVHPLVEPLCNRGGKGRIGLISYVSISLSLSLSLSLSPSLSHSHPHMDFARSISGGDSNACLSACSQCALVVGSVSRFFGSQCDITTISKYSHYFPSCNVDFTYEAQHNERGSLDNVRMAWHVPNTKQTEP